MTIRSINHANILIKEEGKKRKTSSLSSKGGEERKDNIVGLAYPYVFKGSHDIIQTYLTKFRVAVL